MRLENLLKGNCFLNNINPVDKTGNLLPFHKITAKISKDINALQKLVDEDIRSLFNN